MKKLLFVVLIPIFVCTFITSCQDNKEEEIPEIDFEALKEMTEEFASVGIKQLRESVEKLKDGKKNTIYVSVEEYANTRLGKAMADMADKRPIDLDEYKDISISLIPPVFWLSYNGNKELKNFMTEVSNLYNYSDVLQKADFYKSRAQIASASGKFNWKESNSLILLYYTVAAYSKKFHTTEFRNYLNSIANRKACCDWKRIWRNAVGTMLLGATGGAYAGCVGGSLTVPVIGTVIGCVNGTVIGGATGFIGGAAMAIYYQGVWQQ